jgi:hypothetical protein
MRPRPSPMGRWRWAPPWPRSRVPLGQRAEWSRSRPPGTTHNEAGPSHAIVTQDNPEYREIQRAADAQRLSIAAWVRQALAAARRREPVGNVGKKLDSVRAAARRRSSAPAQSRRLGTPGKPAKRARSARYGRGSPSRDLASPCRDRPPRCHPTSFRRYFGNR